MREEEGVLQGSIVLGSCIWRLGVGPHFLGVYLSHVGYVGFVLSNFQIVAGQFPRGLWGVFFCGGVLLGRDLVVYIFSFLGLALDGVDCTVSRKGRR